jgi:hypothetical protein
MLRSRVILSLIAGAVIVSAPAFSQEDSPAYKNEASVQAFGSFVKSTTSNGVYQSATNSGGILTGYRFFFNAHNGVEANYGYAPNTQNLFSASGPMGVKTNSQSYNLASLDRAVDRLQIPVLTSLHFKRQGSRCVRTGIEGAISVTFFEA